MMRLEHAVMKLELGRTIKLENHFYLKHISSGWYEKWKEEEIEKEKISLTQEEENNKVFISWEEVEKRLKRRVSRNRKYFLHGGMICYTINRRIHYQILD
jgi:hypothetical protein